MAQTELFASYFGIDKGWYYIWISEIAAMGYAIATSAFGNLNRIY